MAGSKHKTKVKVGDDVKFGQYANAFRVVEEIGTDCYLDFMVYSNDVEEAVVVSRVRVRKEFLPSIRKVLASVMNEEFEEYDEDAAPIARKGNETLH